MEVYTEVVERGVCYSDSTEGIEPARGLLQDGLG